jgi:hypothetical protein
LALTHHEQRKASEFEAKYAEMSVLEKNQLLSQFEGLGTENESDTGNEFLEWARSQKEDFD